MFLKLIQMDCQAMAWTSGTCCSVCAIPWILNSADEDFMPDDNDGCDEHIERLSPICKVFFWGGGEILDKMWKIRRGPEGT